MTKLKVRTVKVSPEIWDELNNLRKAGSMTWEGLFKLFLNKIKIK